MYVCMYVCMYIHTVRMYVYVRMYVDICSADITERVINIAYFFLHPESRSKIKQTYGFKSSRVAPHVPELLDFENCNAEIIQK